MLRAWSARHFFRAKAPLSLPISATGTESIKHENKYIKKIMLDIDKCYKGIKTVM